MGLARGGVEGAAGLVLEPGDLRHDPFAEEIQQLTAPVALGGERRDVQRAADPDLHALPPEERPLPAGEGTLKGKGARRKGRSTVDDCVIFLARMGGGAVASFEATRLATGNQNRNRIEVNGEKGAFVFDFERMNELLWWDNTLPSAERGWSRIMCTNGGDHPYADAYWPPAHLLGYEHGFVSEAADIVKAVAAGATAAMAGRAYLYGLGAAGERGVDQVLEWLRSDVERTMRLIGIRSIDELSRDSVELPSQTSP